MTTQSHYLYFAQREHRKSGTILEQLGTKVGESKHPVKRMKQLSDGTKDNTDCVVQYLFEFPSYKLAHRTEQLIHAILEERGLHDEGEWFDISPENLFDDFAEWMETAGGCLTSIEDLPEELTISVKRNSSLLDNASFWNKMKEILPDDLPIPSQGFIDKGSCRVLSSMNKTNCQWEYRATTGGQSSVAITTMLEYNLEYNDILGAVYGANRVKQLETLGYTVEVQKPSGPKKVGSVRIVLKEARNGSNDGLYKEMFQAMRDLVNVYKTLPWEVHVNKKKVQ